MVFVPEEGKSIGGRYRLERALARGGMGSIWVARHRELDVPVAIKLMAPEFAASAEARARFEREAKISAQLRIPNVVHVYDYGVEDETPYLAMELLEGEDLEARLAREQRLSPAATLVIVSQVCRALRRAHEIALVHRDLKPANLFLARGADGDEEIVKILDFGIAKSVGLGVAGSATKTGTLLGSPYYMSPEQVRRSKQVDPRSDLWSLGVVIFRCLTGRLPFFSDELGDVLVEICTADIPVPSTLVPALGPSIDGFFARALAREPERRFQSAPELAEAFAAAAVSAGAALPATLTVQRVSVVGAAGGTLAPAGHSLMVVPRQRIGAGVVVASVAGAVTVGLGLAAALLLRAPSPAPPPQESAGANAAASDLPASPAEPASGAGSVAGAASGAGSVAGAASGAGSVAGAASGAGSVAGAASGAGSVAGAASAPRSAPASASASRSAPANATPGAKAKPAPAKPPPPAMRPPSGPAPQKDKTFGF